MLEIKLFYEWLEVNEVSASGISLWHGLMFQANRCGWKEELSIPVSTLSIRTKLSKSTIYRERENLKNYGLIDFRINDGRQSSTYNIKSFESRFMSLFPSHIETQDDKQTSFPSHERLQDETQHKAKGSLPFHNETQSGNLYKQDIHYLKKSKSIFSGLDFITDEIWREIIILWLEYKSSRKEAYKSELSVKKFFNMLRDYSGANPDVAQAIVDKSIANNWKGIFPIEHKYNPRDRPAAGQRIGQIKQPESGERVDRLLRKFENKKK